MKRNLLIILLFTLSGQINAQTNGCIKKDVVFVQIQDSFVQETLEHYIDSMLLIREKFRNGEGIIKLTDYTNPESGAYQLRINIIAINPMQSGEFAPAYYTIIKNRVVVIWQEYNLLTEEIICSYYTKKSIRKLFKLIKPFLPPAEPAVLYDKKGNKTVDKQARDGYTYGAENGIIITYDKAHKPSVRPGSHYN